jgi:aminopeptidase N
MRDRGFSQEFVEITNLMMEVFAHDIFAAGGDWGTVHDHAVELDARLKKLAPKERQAVEFRNDAIRRNAGWLAESALRTGRNEEAVAVARQTIGNPIAGRLNQAALDDALARAKVRLGQALLGSGQRNEAVAAINEALVYYRQQQARGAGGTGPRQDLARALYVLALAQAGDEAGVARRAALLAEAARVLDGLPFEAQQLLASRELIEQVAAARAKGRR